MNNNENRVNNQLSELKVRFKQHPSRNNGEYLRLRNTTYNFDGEYVKVNQTLESLKDR